MPLLPPLPHPLPQWDNGAACGRCVTAWCVDERCAVRNKRVQVMITDLCPECKAGHLDLSQEAFAAIADPVAGRVDITWQIVSPALSGPIGYHFKDGSNQWWTAVQVGNHRNPVARFQYQAESGAWIEVPRTDYNYFVQTEPGMGPGPYQFRVTDSYGNVVIDSGIPHVENGTVDGAAQFPPGP